jgi:exodeoxyribonuclease VII large subunit
MDLFAFCDETLCRTVSLLRVPVIASVGHHTDRTLIDDVAAISCSTPTHAAEAAVPVHCDEARDRLHALGARLEAQGHRAVLDRARSLAAMARAPAAHVERHRLRLHQQLREIRAAATRGLAARDTATRANAEALRRRAVRPRADPLEAFRLALAAHEPQRTLERGYALVEGPDGAPVTSAEAARSLDRMTVRLHDGAVDVRRSP